MFRKRKREEPTAARTADDAYVDVDDERRRRSERRRQLTRAFATLLGAATAGLLIWLATQVGDDSNGGYWAVYGLLAAAGLVFALSQLLGGWTKWGWPKISAAVFLLGFLPVLIVGGWLLVANQPDDGGFRGDVLSWSDDLGIEGVVEDFGEYLAAVALGIGLVFGFSFDTRPRLRAAPVEERERERDVEAVPEEEYAGADEPMTAERRDTAARTRTDRDDVPEYRHPREPREPQERTTADDDGDVVTTERGATRRTDT